MDPKGFKSSKLTSSGYFLNAGSKRYLQYLWNDKVNIGRATSNGVELAAFFVLSKPIKSS